MNKGTLKHTQFKSTFEENLNENKIHHCQYYEEAEVNEKFNCLKTEQFSILLLNILSLPRGNDLNLIIFRGYFQHL